MSAELGKYKPYPEYIDSCIEWLGAIPFHWKRQKISWHFRATKGKNGQLLTKEYCGEHPGEYPVYSGQTENQGVMGSINTFEFDSAEKGVLFSTTVGAKAMNLSHIKGKFSLSQNCMIIIPTSDVINTRYCFYHFQPLFSYERGLIPEHMQASFRMEDLYQYVIAFPSKKEQKTIATFLDYETTRIDRLIAKQQQLIELLKEKRQAVISHVVTKGLNPDVPMKDSGVEWLGQVPEHWDVKPLRYLGSCQNGINISADAFGTGYPFVSYGDVYNNRELPTKPKGLVESSISDRVSYSVKSGDVLFTRTSETIEEIGFTSVCIHEIKDACFAGFIIRFRPSKETLYPYFSKYYFSNNLLRYFFVKEMNLVTRASLSQDLLKKLTVAIPPYDEQVEIADYLNLKNQFFDIAEQSCCKQINLLKERRISLISSAVTGKIDLRNWAPPVTPSDEVA